MTTTTVLLLAAAGALIIWLLTVAFGGFTIPAAPEGRPLSSATREEALERFTALTMLDGPEIAEACRSRLLEPDSAPPATLIIWHGFTNCPAQFAEAAEVLRASGYRVLLPRMPRHGERDVLNRSLLDLTAEELVRFTDLCIDSAVGFGDPVYVFGLSAGGVLAGHAAATRPEVSRAVLAAPFVAPKGIPLPVVRLLIRFRRLIPKIYFWWDPRKKENLGESPYVYPGFPLPGMVPFLHLAQALIDRRVKPGHRLERCVLLSNPGDFAIRRDVARAYARRFDSSSAVYGEAVIDGELGWWHDFVDQCGPHHGTPEQVAAVLLATLGLAEDGSAGGVLATPAPQASASRRNA